MCTWVTPWTVVRDGDRYLVPTTARQQKAAPAGTVCCLVLRTEHAWYVGGDLDAIDDRGDDPTTATVEDVVTAVAVTTDVLDTNLPSWREWFLPGWTPDPRPATAADHLRIADRYANRVQSLIAARGYGNASVEPALSLAAYHQRQAQLRLEGIHRLPVDERERQREDQAMIRYLNGHPPGKPADQN